jgi:hypothetical protein
MERWNGEVSIKSSAKDSTATCCFFCGIFWITLYLIPRAGVPSGLLQPLSRYGLADLPQSLFLLDLVAGCVSTSRILAKGALELRFRWEVCSRFCPNAFSHILCLWIALWGIVLISTCRLLFLREDIQDVLQLCCNSTRPISLSALKLICVNVVSFLSNLLEDYKPWVNAGGGDHGCRYMLDVSELPGLFTNNWLQTDWIGSWDRPAVHCRNIALICCLLITNLALVFSIYWCKMLRVLFTFLHV